MLDTMATKLQEARDEVDKFEGKGNNAAGTRIRKAMLDIKSLASDVRSTVTDIKHERKGV